MNTRNIAIASFKALALSVLAFSAQAAEFVTNGDFSSNAGGGQLGSTTSATDWSVPAPPDSYTFLFNSGSAVNGQYGALGLYDQSTISAGIPGGTFVGMDGAFQVGALTQTINGLTVGDTYKLTFAYGAAQQTGFSGATTEVWSASLGSETHSTPLLNNANMGWSGWNQASFTYTATAASEVLSFIATGTPSGVPPFAVLGDVSLTTPLPAALFFVAPALAGVFGFSRRKQNKA